jgi:hypothetical protein
MRLAEIHKGFFLHTQARKYTTTTALFMPRKKLEREVYREKEREGKGNFFHQWTCWVGNLAKDSQKICSGFCILSSEQESELASFLAPSTSLPSPFYSVFRTLQNKTKQKTTTVSVST